MNVCYWPVKFNQREIYDVVQIYVQIQIKNMDVIFLWQSAYLVKEKVLFGEREREVLFLFTPAVMKILQS